MIKVWEEYFHGEKVSSTEELFILPVESVIGTSVWNIKWKAFKLEVRYFFLFFKRRQLTIGRDC